MCICVGMRLCVAFVCVCEKQSFIVAQPFHFTNQLSVLPVHIITVRLALQASGVRCTNTSGTWGKGAQDWNSRGCCRSGPRGIDRAVWGIGADSMGAGGLEHPGKIISGCLAPHGNTLVMLFHKLSCYHRLCLD